MALTVAEATGSTRRTLDDGYHASVMCREITCPTCGQPGWAGCGRHVDQVLAHVPEDERCSCGAGAAKSVSSGSWLSRILGR